MSIPVTDEQFLAMLDAIFESEPVTVYEAYSEYDKELRVFASANQVLAQVARLKAGDISLVYLSLHFGNAEGYVRKKRITLKPRKCKGATFRYSVEGWGLIHIQLSQKENCMQCELSANSEKRAQKWEEYIPELESAALWNWIEVNKQKRRLNRVLRKSA